MQHKYAATKELSLIRTFCKQKFDSKMAYEMLRNVTTFEFKSGYQRKPGKMLKMSTEGGNRISSY